MVSVVVPAYNEEQAVPHVLDSLLRQDGVFEVILVDGGSTDQTWAIVGELPVMRKEALVLIKDAIGHNRRAYVLVNNRLEGNAPLTVQALTDLLRLESDVEPTLHGQIDGSISIR